MRKIIAILILFFLFSNNAYAKIGKGDLTLTPEIFEYLIKYLKSATTHTANFLFIFISISCKDLTLKLY